MLDCSTLRSHSLAHLSADAPSNSAATLALLPDAAKLLFRGRPSAIEAAGKAFGIALPREACRFAVKERRSIFWLGPDEWLLQANGERVDQTLECLVKSLADHPHSLVDVSHRSDSFALHGPRSDYVLNHACPLDLSISAFPVGMCTRTVLGKATVMLSRPEIQTFHVDVWRSFAPYVWQLLDEARGELG
jgi:sarcosine oxidase subunit gamma